MNMSEPSQAALAAKGGHAGDISLLVIWSCHLTPRMRLRHRKWKEFKRRSVSFRWSKFTAAEQGAENACLVDIDLHLVFSVRYFFFQALFFQFGHGAGALLILREISESKLEFIWR